MGRKKRVASIELLRILAMVMVVTMHFLRESGSMLSADRLSDAPAEQFLGTFLEAFCIVAVMPMCLSAVISGRKGNFESPESCFS